MDKQKKTDSIYINREISWLSFNERVLLEAADVSVPLLERLKFLMIYQSNLEEFYRVRIGILTHRFMLEPWKAIRAELRHSGVEVLSFNKISKVDELMSKKLFGDIRNLLFPKIISLNQPFPFLWGEESYVIAFLGRGSAQQMAVIPMHRVPAYLSFEIDGCQKIVLTDQLVRRFLPLLLKKEKILESAVVKVTRNADVFLSQIADKEDLRQKTSTMLSKRKREAPVRAQIYGKLSDASRALLIKKLHVPERMVFSVNIPFDLSFRSAVGGHDNFRYDERKPAREIGLKKGEYFRYIDRNDLLMSYPFQSMLPFVDLIYEAADDPEVLSIKITLYRMSASSKVAAALAYAADRGKDVLCLLELRARFDEQNNIDYSEMLEDAGCRIIYGLPNHKVHSKLCLITRQHEGNLSYITQVGTGNYNEITGEQYTDLSLITSNPDAARDAEATFEALQQGELPPEAKTLWIAPLSFKSRVIEYLDREIAKGPAGRVRMKINAMNSPEVMEKLIECSKAGVQVELFIRGICCLRPGIPGQTENIVVKSVVGRWLEHSRIYSFGEGEDERVFIGSGDLLNRNLERRVEAFVEITTADTREQIHEILNALRADKEKSRVMQPNGSYLREPGGEGTSSQEALYQYFSRRKVSLKPEKPKAAEKTEEPKEAVKTEAPKKPEKAEESKRPEKPKAEKPAAKPARLVIQSPFGREITPEEVLAKVGEVDTVYIRVDQNKAYWVRGKEYGSVDLW